MRVRRSTHVPLAPGPSGQRVYATTSSVLATPSEYPSGGNLLVAGSFDRFVNLGPSPSWAARLEPGGCCDDT